MATLSTVTSASTNQGCFCGINSEYAQWGRRQDGDSDDNYSKLKQQHQQYGGSHDDAALAKEINELSFEERGRVLDEIHGVAEDHEESPEFLASSIAQLDCELGKLGVKKRRVWDRAVFLKPSILQDSKFKIMFLRADSYDARRAAERMARYFEFKRNLFGDEKLVKTITLDDLDEAELGYFKSGAPPMLVPYKDQTGRPILFNDASKLFSYENSQSMLRYHFYQMSALMEDEAAQKKGVACILYSPWKDCVAKWPSMSKSYEYMMNPRIFTESLPFRVTSFHYCHDSEMTKFLLAMMLAGLGKEIRVRVRTHYGSPTELKYSLLTYGIVMKDLIVAEGEQDEKPNLIRHYLQDRRDVEKKRAETCAAEATKTGIYPFPNQHDVLLGRGRPYPEHSGNRRLLELVDSQMERYKDCKHFFEKSRVLSDVIAAVHKSGGNFLKRCTKGWEVVSDETIECKVRKTFKTRPKGGSSLIVGSRDMKKSVSDRDTKRQKVDPSVNNNNNKQP